MNCMVRGCVRRAKAFPTPIEIPDDTSEIHKAQPNPLVLDLELCGPHALDVERGLASMLTALENWNEVEV